MNDRGRYALRKTGKLIEGLVGEWRLPNRNHSEVERPELLSNPLELRACGRRFFVFAVPDGSVPGISSEPRLDALSA